MEKYARLFEEVAGFLAGAAKGLTTERTEITE